MPALVWNKQRKEERLLDVDDVTLGHRVTMTHNPAEEWIRSNDPAHEAIISPDLFTTAETVRRQRARNCEFKEQEQALYPALEAGTDPAVVTQWINDAQRDKEAARKKLDALPTITRKKESPLNAQQIREITESMENIAQRIHAADTSKKGPLYEALGIEITYEHATRTATVRSRPSSPYRQSLCPRGDLNPHAR